MTETAVAPELGELVERVRLTSQQVRDLHAALMDATSAEQALQRRWIDAREAHSKARLALVEAAEGLVSG